MYVCLSVCLLISICSYFFVAVSKDVLSPLGLGMAGAGKNLIQDQAFDLAPEVVEKWQGQSHAQCQSPAPAMYTRHHLGSASHTGQFAWLRQ